MHLIEEGGRAVRQSIISVSLFILLLTAFLAISLPSPSCAVELETIRDNMNNMTSVAWDDYSKSLKGQRVDWTGWISDVKKQWFGGYKILIDMDPPGSLSVQDVYIEDLPKSLAAQLRKDQNVRFIGKIKSVMKVLGSCAVTLEDVKNVLNVEKNIRIATLEKKVKGIPVAKVADNLRIYKQLLRLNPKNPKYKKKVAFYHAKVDEQKRKAQEAKLARQSESSSIKKPSAKGCVKISDLNTQYTSLGYRVMGRLTNTCDENLDYVAYTITAYDKDGKIIDVLSDYHPCSDGDHGLDAGNSCTFKSITIDGLHKYDIEISKARYR